MMSLLEQEDRVRLRELFDSLLDGSYIGEYGEEIVALLVKYENPLVNKIETINGKPLPEDAKSLIYFCSSEEIREVHTLFHRMVDAERDGIEILEVEMRAMRLQFECFFRMLNAANESIFDEPDDGGLANYDSQSYVVSDNGTFVRSRGV